MTVRLRVPGIHNLRNAVAALAAVEVLGGDLSAAVKALESFEGVGRRFERLGEHGGVAVVDDYAHHPSELAATLSAARQAFPGRRLVAVFQPHLYSRTAEHGQAMGRALAAADLVIVTEVYAAREQPIPGVSGRQVAEAATGAGAETLVRAHAIRARQACARRIATGRRRSHPWRRGYHPSRSRAGPVAGRGLKRSWVVLVAFGGLMLLTLIGPRVACEDSDSFA